MFVPDLSCVLACCVQFIYANGFSGASARGQATARACVHACVFSDVAKTSFVPYFIPKPYWLIAVVVVVAKSSRTLENRCGSHVCG